MEVHELVIEMKLERRLTSYEEKYGILSADFHAALLKAFLKSESQSQRIPERDIHIRHLHMANHAIDFRECDRRQVVRHDDGISE